jgi:hypothetical protein
VIVGCQRNTISVPLATDSPPILKWVPKLITVDAKDMTDLGGKHAKDVKSGKKEPCKIHTAAPIHTATQTASQSSAVSQSSASRQRATHTVSQTSTTSQSYAGSPTGSQPASQIMATPSASASVSANVDGPCDDHLCASGTGCVVVDSETQYMCNCTAINTAAVRRVGQYCNTTLEGKPLSVGDGSANCPGCASLFVTAEEFDGNDLDAYLQSIIPLLAAAYCRCWDPLECGGLSIDEGTLIVFLRHPPITV